MQISTGFDIIKYSKRRAAVIIENIKKVSAEELADILNHKLDFVLELGVLQEPELCVKPIYKFERAFAADEKTPEFCMIYSEADDPEEIYISLNSKKLNEFEKILSEYKNKICKIIFHGENGMGDLCESYYFDGKTKKYINPGLNFKLLNQNDKNLCDIFAKDDDFYLNIIFCDFIENKIYHDCGIIGVFDKNNNFAGYLAYYEIAANIRDISYIYIGEEYRGRGYGKELLNFFANKNTEENKISYYSYAENDISKSLVKSCGFLPCAKRYEREIK